MMKVDDRPAHSGLIAYRGVVPTAALPAGSPFLGDGDNGDGYSHAWVAKHRHFLAYPIARNERLNIVAFITKADRPEETVAVRESCKQLIFSSSPFPTWRPNFGLILPLCFVVLARGCPGSCSTPTPFSQSLTSRMTVGTCVFLGPRRLSTQVSL